MQARCIKAFGTAEPGDVVEGLPDGAAVDPEHWEVIADDSPAPKPAQPSPAAPLAAIPLANTVTPKEGM